MDEHFDVRLLKRSLGATRRGRSTRTLYGDKIWVEDLDIVNELGAHTGCVNALSWSTSGNLLASGSDDTHLNVWAYNPSGSARTFALNTSVSTGHHANIFSVKFMPHSSDRTVVTCAGDSEVRVFDLEYGGTASQAASNGTFAASTRSRRFNNYFQNARWLNEGNTNARVYRSHADRAKRIVTESSPHLFLTCSEDGEVRQWDLRQPSSAYPAPRGSRTARFRGTVGNDGGCTTPPPLISYKRYGLDLNSISCASSQPQYIALGGAHLHCFLHDRRMLGRDLDSEKGSSATRKPVVGTFEDEAMAEATRCVRRFAPNNKRKCGPREHGHITACKISDANPNDMVASWSGDHIYSFDIVKSPDAREGDTRADKKFQANRMRNRSDRKRKRVKANNSSSSLGESGKPSRRLRKTGDDQLEEGQTALVASSELISIPSMDSETAAESSSAHEVLLSDAQVSAERVAMSLVQLRRTLFDFSAPLNEEVIASMEESTELTPHGSLLTKALGQCAVLLPQMDETIRTWTYPVNPSTEDVTLQNTLRRNRQSGWRFVQAAGCLARTLGGRLQSLNSAADVRLAYFDQIKPALHEGKNISKEARFCYDLLKAILLWLEGGQQAVLQGFKRPANFRSANPLFLAEQDDTVHDFIPKLEVYLLDLADEDKAIVDLDTNRFERDETRQVFQTEKSAVLAFIRALANIKLEVQQGLSESTHDPSNSNETIRVMDKGAAARFWGVKVGRSLLMRAAEGVTFDFVNRAFGGLSLHTEDSDTEEEPSREEIYIDDEEQIVDSMEIVTAIMVTDMASQADSREAQPAAPPVRLPRIVQESTRDPGQVATEIGTPPMINVVDADGDEGDESANEDEDEEDDEVNNDSDDDAMDSEDDLPEGIILPRRLGLGRSRNRASVNLDVPYSSHTKMYKGHRNERTVKDVNFYGLNDEYVVSGSDDGHFFIWDRKTSKILNILEGDGEVVNVVQGHPYEPIIACSGIDSTVKIFGAAGENREREAAEKGIDIANPRGSTHSSLSYGGRRGARRTRDGEAEDSDEQEPTSRGLDSRRAMHRSYEITSQNDAGRRRTAGDEYFTRGSFDELMARAWIMSSLHMI